MKDYIQHQKKHSEQYEKIADKWEEFRHKYYKSYPEICKACGEKIHIDLHHIIPRHINPSLIFTTSNLIPLCRSCHFHIGHLLHWDYYNPSVVSDSKLLRHHLTVRFEQYLDKMKGSDK